MTDREMVLYEALDYLVQKLDYCQSYIDNVFFMTYELRGGKYYGPTYEKELKIAKKVLLAKSAVPDQQDSDG